MPIQGGMKYQGRVEPGSRLWEAKTGSLAFRVQLSCEDGPCHHDIWLSSKTIDRAEETFMDVLGIPREKLRDGDYVADQLATDIVGRHVEFETEDEDYNGNTTTKVKWLNCPGGRVNAVNPRKMSDFFSRERKPATDFPKVGLTPIDDSEIPF